MQKKHRRTNNKGSKSYFISGLNPVITLLEHNPSRVLSIVISAKVRVSGRFQQAFELIHQHEINIKEIDPLTFKESFQGVTQGIAAEVLTPKARSNNDFSRWLENELPENALLLVLDQIQDPHNLGAILRTADAASVDAVIMSEKNSVPLNSTVSKVASGAAESIPLFSVTNLSRSIELIKQKGVWLVGTTDHADNMLYDIALPDASLALVVGSEGTGMRRLTEQACDYLVKLPMEGIVNSLNVSVATGICLYEINRRRKF